MIKLLLITFALSALHTSAWACDMRTDDLLEAQRVDQIISEEQTAALRATGRVASSLTSVDRALVTCYARDRFGNYYSGTHPHAFQAEQRALRECERASRAMCWQAGCRRPADPFPFPPEHGHGRRHRIGRPGH